MKRHPIDLVAFVLGLLFMALAVGFLLDALDVWHADIGWVPPIVLVALGLAGVLSTATRASAAARHSRKPQPPIRERRNPSTRRRRQSKPERRRTS